MAGKRRHTTKQQKGKRLKHNKGSSKEWSIEGKTVLITGANTGIGKATAIELSRRGARRIIIACRNVKQAEEAAVEIKKASPTGKIGVAIHYLDLSSLQSVRKFARKILATEKVVNVLINNAGTLAPSTYTLTDDGFEKTFATNHLGHFLLTNLLLDLLDKSGPSRIINVSTHWLLIWWYTGRGFPIENANFTRPGSYSQSQAYVQSKLANVLFTRGLHQRLQKSKKSNRITTYSLHPGIIGSDITRDYNVLVRLIIPYVFKSTTTGAKTTVYCATEPNIEHLSSHYFMDSAEQMPTAAATDDEMAERLWTLSEQLVKLSSKHDG